MEAALQLGKQEISKNIDWRIIAGMAASIIWLLLLMLYIFQQINWQQFLQLPLDQVGSFLGGAFSPLAFLWLVIGFFIQQGEIFDNTQNIEAQAKHTNLDNFLKMADIVYQHLGVISGFLAASCQEDLEAASSVEWVLDDIWSKASNGDAGIFARTILTYHYDKDENERDMSKIFYSTPIRTAHSLKYKAVFKDLLDNAMVCDPTGSLKESLQEGSIWGILYKVILETDRATPLVQKEQ